MIREDLVTAVHQARGRDVPRARADEAVRAILVSIGEGLREDGVVQIAGFGTFRVEERTARTGRHPGTGEALEIPPATTIRFERGERARVDLGVYDLTGRKVRVLVSDVRERGSYRAVWDGRNDEGRAAGSGSYLIRLVTPDGSAARKITLIR